MVCSLVSIYFSIALNLGFSKNKLYKTFIYSSRDVFDFNFPEKGLGLVSPPHLVYDFSRKMFLKLYFLTDQTSLSDCLYFSRYWAVYVLQLFAHQTVTS